MTFLDFLRSTDTFRALTEASDSQEGNSLEWVDEATAGAQIEFHRWALWQVMEKEPGCRVLEIGHNKGMFGLLLSHIRPWAGLVALDGNPASARAAAILNARTTLTVTFHQGDSTQVMPGIQGRFSYAWVDGGHDTEVALSDLRHCDRLRIPWVAVDDTAYGTVADAIAEWRARAPYVEIANPFIASDSRQARLFRRGV